MKFDPNKSDDIDNATMDTVNCFATPFDVKNMKGLHFSTSKIKTTGDPSASPSYTGFPHATYIPLKTRDRYTQAGKSAEGRWGNDVNIATVNKATSARDGMRRGTFRRTEQFKHNIFSLACEHFNLILEIFSYGMQGKFIDSKRWLS